MTLHGVGRNRRGAWLVLVVGCATPQREPAIEGAGGGAPGAPVTSVTGALQALRIITVAPGRFVLQAAAPTQVLATASIQYRLPEGQWSKPANHELRESCAAPAAGAAKCVEILPGKSFAPLSWNGSSCRPCCDADEYTALEPGEYRLAVAACDDPRLRWEGPSFEVPSTTAALERWRAASNVQKVSGFQLELDRAQNAKVPDEERIFGYPIVPGSEVVLSEAIVSALVDWLRDPKGFIDNEMQRCLPGKKFGFRLDRRVREVGHEQTEIAIDIGCSSILIDNQEGGLHAKSYSGFGDSRQSMREIVRQIMPGARLSGRTR